MDMISIIGDIVCLSYYPLLFMVWPQVEELLIKHMESVYALP